MWRDSSVPLNITSTAVEIGNLEACLVYLLVDKVDETKEDVEIVVVLSMEEDVEISPIEVDDALVIEDDGVSEDDDDEQDDVCL
ncbi:hypothetical protein Tco_0485397 [Tanacetum coccineum]